MRLRSIKIEMSKCVSLVKLFIGVTVYMNFEVDCSLFKLKVTCDHMEFCTFRYLEFKTELNLIQMKCVSKNLSHSSAISCCSTYLLSINLESVVLSRTFMHSFNDLTTDSALDQILVGKTRRAGL